MVGIVTRQNLVRALVHAAKAAPNSRPATRRFANTCWRTSPSSDGRRLARSTSRFRMVSSQARLPTIGNAQRCAWRRQTFTASRRSRTDWPGSARETGWAIRRWLSDHHEIDRSRLGYGSPCRAVSHGRCVLHGLLLRIVGALNSAHIHGAHAPVQEPSTASHWTAARLTDKLILLKKLHGKVRRI